MEDDDDGAGSADSGEGVDGGDGSKTYDEGDAVDGGGGIVDGSNDESARDDGDADDAAKNRSQSTSPNGAALVKCLPGCERCRWKSPPVKFANPSRAGLTTPGGAELGFAKPITSIPPPHSLPEPRFVRLHRPTPNLHLYLRCRSRLLRIRNRLRPANADAEVVAKGATTRHNNRKSIWLPHHHSKSRTPEIKRRPWAVGPFGCYTHLLLSTHLTYFRCTSAPLVHHPSYFRCTNRPLVHHPTYFRCTSRPLVHAKIHADVRARYSRSLCALRSNQTRLSLHPHTAFSIRTYGPPVVALEALVPEVKAVRLWRAIVCVWHATIHTRSWPSLLHHHFVVD